MPQPTHLLARSGKGRGAPWARSASQASQAGGGSDTLLFSYVRRNVNSGAASPSNHLFGLMFKKGAVVSTSSVVAKVSGVKEGAAVLRVTDRGIGIPAADLPRLFEPFYTRRRGGTGLGLAIVKALVEKMGGAVEVESRYGNGTRFCLRIPFEVAQAAEFSADAPTPPEAPMMSTRRAPRCSASNWTPDPTARCAARASRCGLAARW